MAAAVDPGLQALKDYGRWLFVNIQTPGVTFAITGPWDNGAL